MYRIPTCPSCKMVRLNIAHYDGMVFQMWLFHKNCVRSALLMGCALWISMLGADGLAPTLIVSINSDFLLVSVMQCASELTCRVNLHFCIPCCSRDVL